MRDLEIGKPYQEGLERIPESIVFDFTQNGGFLRIVFDSPLDNEIEEIKQGNIKLGLLRKEEIIFFFIKLGKLPWMEASYNVSFSQPFELLELTNENKGYTVQVVLIDGMTGIVKALKLIGLPHDMSLKFKEMVEKQRQTPIKDYEATLNRIFSSYDIEDLLKSADKYLI